jgi:hypothetical protein
MLLVETCTRGFAGSNPTQRNGDVPSTSTRWFAPPDETSKSFFKDEIETMRAQVLALFSTRIEQWFFLRLL